MAKRTEGKTSQGTTGESEGLPRRGFLRALGSGGALAAAGVIVAAPGPAAAIESDADKKKARYRETDHVKAYYRTNRY